jgi:CubicO group peptidase (beta-lactamase class C family)
MALQPLAESPQRKIWGKEDAHCLAPLIGFCGIGDCLVTTLQDYWLFAQMLVDGRSLLGRRLLSRKALDLMSGNRLPKGQDLDAMGAPPVPWLQTQGNGYGFGFAVTIDQESIGMVSSVGEFNWGGGLETSFFVDRKEGIVALFFTQMLQSGTVAVRKQFRAKVYEAIEVSDDILDRMV